MIKLNEDEKTVKAVRKKLKENDGYCPCRLQKTLDTKCMCKEFREAEEGLCHCGLYRKIKDLNIYLAGSMFCEGDRMYNAYIADAIRKQIPQGINLYVPQENKSINDKTKCADSAAIYAGDYERLQNTDILIARIDGDVIPSGTSAEIGIMCERIEALKKSGCGGRLPMIIGLCTDSRNPKRTYLDAKNTLMKENDYESQYCYYNLFTIGCIKVNGRLATSVNELVEILKEVCSI